MSKHGELAKHQIDLPSSRLLSSVLTFNLVLSTQLLFQEGH